MRLKSEFTRRLAKVTPFTRDGLLKGSVWQKVLDRSPYRPDGQLRTGRPEVIEQASVYEEG